MFHEVKIFDKRGKVKKVLSSKKLSNEYSRLINPLENTLLNVSPKDETGPSRTERD